MEFSEYSENEENRPHSGKKHVELSTHNVKSGLVSSITGLIPRASHGGLLSSRHPNINTCAVNNQMKESVAEVDVRGVTHARRHTQPVEHEPALNITMSPVPAIDAQVANFHHSQTLSLSPTPPPCCSSQAADNFTSITQESTDEISNESKLTEIGNTTRSVGRGGGRRRCYSNQHTDTLNLFATNTSEEPAALSDNQITQCSSAHEQHTTCHSNLTNLERQITKIDKNNKDSDDDDDDAEQTNSYSSTTTVKRHAGKMQSDKFHSVTQTSEENAIAFLQDLCSSAVNNETAQRKGNHREYSDDIVHYAQQLLRQVNDINDSGSIDIVKQVEKLQRRIASDTFVANSEYKPKSASIQHNMQSANVVNDDNTTNSHKETNNTVSTNEHSETKQQEKARANSTRRTNSPSPVPVYVRIAKNPQGNYTHYDEFGNVVISTTSSFTTTTATTNTEMNSAYMATKQLEFATRPPLPPPSLQQTEKSLQEEHKHQKMPGIVNANTSSVECDTIFNAQYPPPPAVGVQSPLFQRKMLVKPILQPYSQSSTTELHEGSNDDNQTQLISRQTSLSRKAQNNVECMEDYDTLALKRARARAASRSQEQINANDNKETISKDGDDVLENTKRAKVEQKIFAIGQSANTTTIATSVENKTVEDHANHININNSTTDKNDNECESDRPRSQRGLLEREMEMKWKAREEAALQHKSGRALTGQNYKKTSLW